MKRYYPIPLHMHSIWERSASMEGHFYNAQKLGIRHMYLTDHDVRMGPRQNHIDRFDFSKGVLLIEEESPDILRPLWNGFQIRRQDDGTTVCVKDHALRMTAESVGNAWTEVRAEFDSSQKRHEYALLANVILHLGLQISPQNDDMRAIIDVKLSQRPPDFSYAHILYVFGNCDGLDAPHTAIIPMKSMDSYHRLALSLLEDAASVGGGDNILHTVSFSLSARNGAAAHLHVDHLSFSWDIAFEEGRKKQQELATEIGKKYGVTPFVTSEITGAGPHKICFSTSVPCIDYAALNFAVTDEMAMEHVLAHGGIYSRNHPFESLKDRVPFCNSQAEIEDMAEKLIQRFVENKAWNATMLEVGFPHGRNAFSFDMYLRLWDTLSSNGIFITGYGDSDNHTNDTRWFDGNNFVAYIAADVPNEDNFIEGMKEGNVYTGDPVYLQKMTVDFQTDDGQKMGQVSVSSAVKTVRLSLSGVPDGCRVVWTANGENVRTESCETSYNGAMEIPQTASVNFVRASLYKDNRCILLTNPVYQTLDSEIIPSIPKERRFFNDEKKD